MFYRFWWLTLVPVIRAYLRLDVAGKEHLPRRGAAILASNHISGIDPGLVGAATWRRIRWLAKIDLVRRKRVAWFFRSVAVIPIDRDAPQEEALAAAAGVLAGGELFAVFPEGSRSPDGRVHRGFTGVARIAARSGAPVIPVALSGSDLVAPKGKLFPRLHRCGIRFGAPMLFAVREGEDEPAAIRRFTDEVMGAIAGLGGRERVDRYVREPRRVGTRGEEHGGSQDAARAS